jgi:hypothetical protein
VYAQKVCGGLWLYSTKTADGNYHIGRDTLNALPRGNLYPVAI